MTVSMLGRSFRSAGTSFLRAKPPRTHKRGVVRATAFLLAILCLLLAPQTRAQTLQPGGPVDFGSVALGSSSLNLTLTFSATTTTTITGVTATTFGTANKDFVLVAQTCTGTLSPGQSCNVTIAFKPQQIGLREGALSITASGGAVNRQFLHGIGLGPQIVFSPVSAATLPVLPSNFSPRTYTSSSSVFDGAGDLYFNDFANSRILEQTLNGNVTLIAASQPGTVHSSIAINGAGTLYVSSPSQGTVQAIIPGVSNTALATPGVTLVSPAGVAVDAGGNIYIADSQANDIVRVAYDGSGAVVMPLTGLATPLSSPYGLAVDNTFLYIADSGNGRIVEVNINTGAAVALTANGALSSPYGIAVDPAGTVIVANAGGGNVEQVSPAGNIFSFTPDYSISVGSSPLGVTFKSTGDVIISDSALGLVTVTRSTGSLTFATPTKVAAFDATDGYETATLQNSGNQTIQFSSTTPAINSTAFALGTNNTCPVQTAATTPFALGATCFYSIGFTPNLVGTDSGVLAVSGTAVGTLASITADVDLSGTGVTPVDTLSVTATPSTTTPGTPVSFTVTALQGTTVVTAFTGTVNFTMTDPTGKFLGGTSYTFTPADAGVHTFPAGTGAQFNQTGTFTISAHLGTIVGISNTVTVQYGTAIQLTSSVNPVFTNANTTLSAVISATGISTPATGTVTFYDGAATIGTCTLASSKCSITVSFATAGNHSITAYYGGDANYSFITSTALIQVVNAFTATVSIASSINPSLIGQQTIFTATVANTGQAGSGTPTGTVTFKEGSTTIGTVTLVNGVASIPDTFATTGNHLITVAYSGDTSFAPVTPPAYTQIVNSYTSQTVLASSVNPSIVNQNTVLTATISASSGQSSGPTPTGTVTFKNGTTVLATIAVTNGVASYTISFATPGTYFLTAVYSGDTNYATSVSNTVNQVVNATGFTSQFSSFTSSINPTFVGQSTSLAVTVIATAGQAGAGTPTGTITFKDGTATIGTATLIGGSISLPASFAAAGTHPLTAVYSGDANFSGATSNIILQVVNSYTAQVSLLSSINPSFIGQSTTLTATVANTGQSGSGTPTGNVTFKDGATTLGISALVNGVATLPASFATSGNHSLTAVYAGDTNFAGTTSAVYTQVVSNYAAQAAISSSINPSFLNQSTTFTATISAVAGQTGAGTPTGTVTFLDGGTTLGTATLVSGKATLPASFATTGNHNITAVYSGDTNFAGFTSAIYIQVVNTYTSQAGLTSSINPSVINQSTVLTATVAAVAGQAGAGTPTGTVTFKNGTTTIGTATLVSGIATLSTSFALVGTYTLTAVYSGDANFTGVTSNSVIQVVTDFTAQVALTSSINPSFIGEASLLTATVTATPGQTGAGTPTGTITFKSGTNTLGTGTLINGVATLSETFLTTGTFPLTAVYSGDNNFLTATSATVTQVVNNYTATVGLTSSVNPSLVNQSTTLTATVAAVAGQAGSVTPTGTITFRNGATNLGTVTLVNGVATFATSFATAGSYSLNAIYSGDTNYIGTSSGTVTQVVTDYTATATLTSSIEPSYVTQQTTLTATIAAGTGQTGAPTPTGTVVFKDGATTLGTVTLVAGIATLPIAFTNYGSHNLTCTYSGDANYLAATCPVYPQLVVKFAATISITDTPNPVFLNQPTTITPTFAVVTAPVTSPPVPTGSVTYYDGTTVIATVNLVNGVPPSVPYTPTTVGTHTLSCTYSGDNNFLASTCANITEGVNHYASQAGLTSTPNPSLVTQPVVFTATISAVTGQAGAPTPLTGTVTFIVDGVSVAPITLGTSDVATLTLSNLAAGNHTVTCNYSGDANYNSSTCGTVAQVVNDYTAQVALTSSINPTFVNQQTTFTATVSAIAGQTGSATPTGTVTFKNGTTTIGTGTLVNGVATLAYAFSTAGSYPITAVYNGSTTYATVTSAVLTQVVGFYTAGVSVTSSNNPSFINVQTTFTATVTPTSGQNSPFLPTGTVTFLNGTTPLGTVPLTAGTTATYSASFASVGTYPITAVYSGDANFTTATSPSLNQVVEDFSIATAAGTSSTATVLGGYATSYTFTVTPIGGSGFAGPISFSLSGFPVGTTATFTPASLTAGEGATNVTLSVKPPPITQANFAPKPNPNNAAHYTPIVLALLFLPFAARRRRRRFASLFLWMLLAVSAVSLTGCVTSSSSGYYGTNAQTSTLTVTAYSGTLSHSTTVTLIVQ